MSKKFIYLFSAASFWAVSILLIKYILNNGENAYNLIFWAALLSIPYWIYVFYKNSEKVKQITKTDIWILLGIGFINTAAVNVVEMFAIKYTQAINYSFQRKFGADSNTWRSVDSFGRSALREVECLRIEHGLP